MPDLDDPNHAISFDADTIAAALVNIYQKKYGNGREIEPTLFEKTKEIFEGAINKGVKQSSFSIDTAFKHQLTHNMWVFSAFRTHKMQRDIAKYLLNEKGELKTFTKFVKDVAPYIKHTNRLWLETEYNTAVLRAHQAADWRKFVDERDVLPNLEWQPSTSTNPGADHQPYWFTCLPINHKFWKQHRPGDRWNCKCSLRNTDKEPTPVPADTIIKGSEPQRGLESNPGEKGEIFSNNHPYYPENCGKCPFNKGVGRLWAALVGTKRDCNGCNRVEALLVNDPKKEFIEQRRQEYERYKNDPDYEDVQFDEATGGVFARHKDHNHGTDPTPYLKHLTPDGSGYKGWELEDFCVEQLFKMGNSVIVQPEGRIKTITQNGVTHYTALDLILNGTRVDIRSITENKKFYINPLSSKNKQLYKWNDENPNDTADGTLLYFYDPEMFSPLKVKDGITHYLNNLRTDGTRYYGHHNYLKHVYCVVRGVNRIYKYDVK